MKSSLRATLAPLAVTFCCGAVALACPQLTEELGLNVWNYGSRADVIRNDQELRTRLGAADERIQRRLRLKGTVTQDVIDGRVDLDQATEQFMAYNQVEPEIATATRHLFPAPTERESTAQQVLSFVRSRLAHEASRRDEVVGRLEAQLAAMRGSGKIETH